MKNQAPLNSCETGSCTTRAKHCSPCMKRMMFMIPLVLIIAGGYFAYSYFSDSQNQQTTQKSEKSLPQSGQYQEYSQSKYNELVGKKPLALFFHASWCPTCRAEEKLIQENLSVLPKDLTILKADYDTETELKKKYGITMQSIIVVLDESGKEIGRIGDFSSIDKLTDITSNISSVSAKTKVDPKDTAVKTSGEMLPFSQEQLTKSLAENKTVVIAFAADWCPSCKSLEKDIMENIKNIPENTALLRADFDTEKELNKKYGITMQHTFVQVDKNQDTIKKWSGSTSLEELIGNIQ